MTLALMTLTGILKDGTVSEQWRLQWGYPPFRVDRDRLIGRIVGSIARRKHRTAKLMAPYYGQLFTANPMALTPLSVDDLRGSNQGHESCHESSKRLTMQDRLENEGCALQR